MHESRHDFPSPIPKEHLRDARDVDVGLHCFEFSDVVAEEHQPKLSTESRDVDRGTSMLQLEVWHLYVIGGIKEFRKGIFNDRILLPEVTLRSGVSRRRYL